MTPAMRARWAAVVGGAAICVAAACAEDGTRKQIDTTIARPSSDGLTTDSVEMEIEPDTGPPPTILRSSAPDTVITSRVTPALTKPIDAMSNSEVVNYLRKLGYKRQRRNVQDEWVACTHAIDGSACNSAAESAHVYIQPEAGMNKLRHDAVPRYGVVVARITNDSYGLDAAAFGYKARRKTWWIVDSSGGTLRSRFFVRTYSKKGPPIQFVTTSRQFVLCSHDTTTHPRAARAKFWTCAQSAADTALAIRGRAGAPAAAEELPSYVRFASLRSAVPVPAEPKPLPVYALTTNWVSCGAGCCATSP